MNQIELVDDGQPITNKQDLRDYDNSELYMIIRRTYELNNLFNNSASLDALKKRIDPIFQYTAAQWEFVQVEHEMNLEGLA